MDKDKNYKLIPFRIDDEKLLEKCKTIWTKIETLNSLPVHSNRYIKTKVRTHGDKFYNNYRGLIVSEYDAKCIIISVDSFPVYGNKSYLQV